MNYKIINNEKILTDFIQWLPDLLPHEIYYVALFSRNKYAKSTKPCVLKKFLARKDFLFNRIKQLECPLGTYQNDNDFILQESLALYITVNPRDLKKATKNCLVRFAELITQDNYTGYNPYQEVMSEIHKSCTRKVYIDFDYDDQEETFIKNEIAKVLNLDCVSFLKTKNGVHALVEVKKIQSIYEKNWYKNLTAIPGCDVKGDNLIPVPGCTQGNFVPFFLESINETC